MFLSLKKLFLGISQNVFLLLVFIILIQNTNLKSKVKLFSTETIELPISFIIGSSYICGSTFSLLIPLKNSFKILYRDNKCSPKIILVTPFNFKFLEAIVNTLGFGTFITF